MNYKAVAVAIFHKESQTNHMKTRLEKSDRQVAILEKTKGDKTLWTYATLEDNTTVAYSETKKDGTVRIVVERPIDYGFDHAETVIPDYSWKNVEGYSKSELENLAKFLKNNSPLIYEMADEKHLRPY